MSEVPELFLIDKPTGKTSMDIIRILRRKLDVRKIGHAGTLDPLATGLMLVGVGPGTKKLTDLVKLDKEYRAEIRIGERRSTGDLEGIILEEKEVVALAKDDVEAAVVKLVGTLTLPVSAYSAIKVDGVPMYRKARRAERKGEQVEDVPLREMKVISVTLEDLTVRDGRAVATVLFSVGSGTYVRSLAEELGRLLDYPATLQNLRRTKVGEFDIKDAQVLEDI